MKTLSISALAAAGLALAAGAAADTLHVPGDYPTIQAAVNAAAQAGDTVLVADGTFPEKVDTLGKAVAVKSEHGLEVCKVNGFTIHSGEGPGTLVEGFRIGANGVSLTITDAGPVFTDCKAVGLVTLSQASPAFTGCSLLRLGYVDFGVQAAGGAPSFTGCLIEGGATQFKSSHVSLADCDIRYIQENTALELSDCQASLQDCRITGNEAWGVQYGGGAAVYGGWAQFTGCTISNNSVGDPEYPEGGGGGVYSDAAAELILDGCTLENNHAADHVGETYGGNAVLVDGKATISSCTFRGNHGAGSAVQEGYPGGPVTVDGCAFENNVIHGDYGGAPAIAAGDGWVIQGCTFAGNRTGWEGDGGAVALGNGAAMTDCLFLGNTADWAGGAIWCYSGASTVVNCIFVENSAAYAGGAVALYSGGHIDMLNCTFVGNEAPTGGVVYTSGNSEADIANSVLWANTPDQISGTVTVRYSDIQGGYAGDGNIDSDPFFADAPNHDVTLSPGSPCIDAADNSAVPEGIVTDYAGLPRLVDDPATPDTGLGTPPIVDMGAHEFQGAPCYADFDGDGSVDLFDFLAFINAFNAGEPHADCTADGAIDLFDFLCFTNAFNEGC